MSWNRVEKRKKRLDKNKKLEKIIQIHFKEKHFNYKKKGAILSLEKEIKDLTENDDKSDDKKNKEIEEITHLTELTTKWKAACQEGIIELQKQLTDTYPDMTMNKIVDLLKVDPKDIDYDPETQDFV
ncbi:hypothetical protein PPERSA_08699 [Pseudocohnilembus persalinus]|uniref:Meiosis protein 5 homolog n=1 Tax=Pseudocohnilembus persalinus TaxID=266149 RepID=A0A0V0R8J7_PSEPJ|nr:hypothetical protein PPERSA_08699 [Pseudocohnilembus persalinus]|eukprot:KRX10704.1 hypothetical protein PPERSA_08699 [Pseudocohnilembus persalinus]